MSHSTNQKRRVSTVGSLVVAASVVAAAASGMAYADPIQGGTQPGDSGPAQGGSTPRGPGASQGGTQTPPAPAPAPAPEVTYTPPSDQGTGIVPSPPQGQWETTPEVPQTYNSEYTPQFSQPIHPLTPTPTPPVPRKTWQPETLRVGNFVVPENKIPDFPRKQGVIKSTNEWSAYAESEIARALISWGVPRDEASRKAAAITAGAVAAGAVGGAVTFTATALAVGVIAIPVGALIGLGVGAAVAANPLTAPAAPFAPAIGAGIGAGAGVVLTVAAATLAGTAAAIGFGVAGGLLGNALGAGDPGANTKRPGVPDLAPEHAPSHAAPTGGSGSNQFEVRLDAKDAGRAGLPQVDYVVRGNGDVSASAQVGSQHVSAGWSAAQAQAPIQALGAAAPAVQHQIDEGVRDLAPKVAKAIPGLKVSWGQPAPSSHH